MPGFLERIVETKRREVAELRRAGAIASAASNGVGGRRGFLRALRGSGLQAIAEFKRRSPSKGRLGIDADPSVTARAYEAAGAAAMSVLTDREFFGGTLADLVSARAACSLPILRKDFIVDPLQVVESHEAGADAILLIVRILSDLQLGELHGAAQELQLDVLIEVHDQAELDRALRFEPAALGINCRDLDSFETDLKRSLQLASGLPAKRIRVAESGIRDAADASAARAAGFDAILVGEALMRSDDPASLLRQLLSVPTP